MERGRQRNPEDDDAPYLPERYRQHVHAKKQRRFREKILIAAFIVVLAAVLAIVILGDTTAVHQQSRQTSSAQPVQTITTTQQTGAMSQSTLSNQTRNMTIPVTPPVVLGAGLQNQTASGMLTIDAATDLIRLEYPARDYTITSINLTETDEQKYYEFGIIPHSNPVNRTSIFIGIDAVSGDPYSPTQDTAIITAEQAKRIVSTSFPSQKPDQIRVRYRNDPDTLRSWHFFLIKMNKTILSGSLDPETGQITSFNRQVPATGQPAAPVISLTEARKIADRIITGWNGPLSINMSDGRYEARQEDGTAVGGRYIFKYDRMVQDLPCDVDGFTVTIDSVTGDVIGYGRRWNNPDNAFSLAAEPLVTKREATFAILEKAMEIDPGSINSVRIISTRLQWKDGHAPGVTPRPGSIPLVWNVAFDDETFRAVNPPIVATGWVDAQTGAILDMNYHH